MTLPDSLPPCPLLSHCLYRYAQVQHYGGFTLSALLGCLIIALAVVFYTQQPIADGRPRAGRKLRSTEYVE